MKTETYTIIKVKFREYFQNGILYMKAKDFDYDNLHEFYPDTSFVITYETFMNTTLSEKTAFDLFFKNRKLKYKKIHSWYEITNPEKDKDL